MKITEIDAVSYAASIGHAAASRFYALLSGVEVAFLNTWFDPTSGEIELDVVNDTIGQMAAYVCGRNVTNPEQLYRHAEITGLTTTQGIHFLKQDLVVRESYRLFVETCRTVHDTLAGEQKRTEEAEVRAKAKTVSRPLPREDSIFEKEGRLDDLNEAMAAEKKRGKVASRRSTRRQTKPKSSNASQTAKPATMSVGTAPAKQPVNRGGRGRKKQPAS